MPELPEVETVRRTLRGKILGLRVVSAELLRRDVLIAPGDPRAGHSRTKSRKGPARATPDTAAAWLLGGTRVVDVVRRGKQLAIVGERDSLRRALGVHLGMTGRLEYHDRRPAPLEPHTHALLTLERGVVSFRDPRRFGNLRVCASQEDLDALFADLGPDALDIAPSHLAGALRGSSRAIKAALLDQAVLAGVGNIYADEALHIAGIAPAKPASRLNADSLDRLCAAIRKVLANAVDAGGSTRRDFVNADGEPGRYQQEHRVYGRGGKPCLTCGRVLSAARVGQRQTVWCTTCQPMTGLKKQKAGVVPTSHKKAGVRRA